ncbi:DUF222 domain-containing protein [Cellulomonas sp. ATA003]|uniref:DUF222 domain-containing protein n=1 Tax=Cellulomonas sp. ATA003 TaxID=3073064 RepID=UPI0028734D09|nr:DUF222 domain-containing protein [Cellulomonas sp. ATA003]WNB86729.1 DUF222 domain-containing protein [Cellulomonas sp. ATA003]
MHCVDGPQIPTEARPCQWLAVELSGQIGTGSTPREGEMGLDNTPVPPKESAQDASTLSSEVALSPGIAAALSAMDSAVAVLAGLDLSELDGRQAAVVARRLAEVTSRAGVAKVRLLPVIDDDGVWALSGARSFPVWLSHDHRLSVGVARAQVRLGRTLRDHLPLTAAAAVAGDVTVEQAQVIATLAPTSEQRRHVLADPEQECNESFVVEQAGLLSVDETRVFVRKWAAYADPDADDRGYVVSCERERLDIARFGDGYRAGDDRFPPGPGGRSFGTADVEDLRVRHRIIHDRDITIRRHHDRWEFNDRHGNVIDPDRDRPLAAGWRERRRMDG